MTLGFRSSPSIASSRSTYSVTRQTNRTVADTSTSNYNDLLNKTKSTCSHNYQADRLKKEIQHLNKIINTNLPPRMNFKNRPPLNLNRPETSFERKDYFAYSPTANLRSFVVNSNVKCYESKKANNFHVLKDNLKSKRNENRVDYEIFAYDLKSTKQHSVIEKYTAPKSRKQSLY
jgi:hypothetical protein